MPVVANINSRTAYRNGKGAIRTAVNKQVEVPEVHTAGETVSRREADLVKGVIFNV
jgi:hypothetical protein